MHAMVLQPDKNLQWHAVDALPMAADEVTIDVYAAGLNRADLMQRAGVYPPPPGASEILGLECSGVISAVGDQVTQWQVGDRVCALLAGGGYADTVVCKASHCLPVPDNYSVVDAAALPEVFATAWLNIFMEAQTPPQKPVLIHAGASGVGGAAIQLCKAFNHPCFVTVSSQAKLDYCTALGADAGFLYPNGDFSDAAKTFTQGKGFATILDPVGGNYLESNIKLLDSDGALVIIGIMGGRKNTLDLGRLLVKRIRIVGSTLRSRDNTTKDRLIASMIENLWPLFDSGQLKPQIHRVYPIAQANQALEEMANNANLGKIILQIRE